MNDRSFDNDEEFDETDIDDALDELTEVLPCPNCGADVYEDAEQCPVCGYYITSFNHRPWSSHGWWWIALGAVGTLATIYVLLLG